LPFTSWLRSKVGRVKVLRRLIHSHPRTASFMALSTGMVVILLVAARGVGLEPGQKATLIVSTVLVAGLCVWIIHWE